VYNKEGVFSEVDCESPDNVAHPAFQNAHKRELVLEPGEALFLPVGWWHHVRALDVSITVTFTNFIYPNSFEWDHPHARV
jgi:ribosomal protein L16 Arg81 hydroxylase